jgi:tetratricopeptide (TPR) repeat protein
MRIFLFDSLLTTRTFIAKEGEEVIATTTLVFDSEVGLPSDGIYKDRLDKLRSSDKSICEISKLSTRRDLGAKALRILPYLFRSCWLYAKNINPHNYFCIMVEPQNEGFYQKSYFFENNSEIRLDHKAGEAQSILLEMPINYSKDSFDLSNARSSKLYHMHFEDPKIEEIEDELKNAEETISRINLSLQPTRKSRTLALTSEEKKFLEFKFFIIRYNLDQISKYALSQSSKGWLHDALDSYENLMKTIPSWAFSKEKDKIYEKLTELFLSTSSYDKLIEVSKKLKNSSNTSASIQGRNTLAFGLYLKGDAEEAFAMLKEAELMAREHKDNIRLYRNYYNKAMILNHQRKFKEALLLINEALETCKNEISFRESSTIQYMAFCINQHLGKIKACKALSEKLIKEFHDIESEKDVRILANYYSCLSRYNIFSMHSKKAATYSEILIKNSPKKEETPWHYAANLSNYSLCLLAMGEIDIALQKIEESLSLKVFYPTINYLSFLIKKFNLLVYKANQAETISCKIELDLTLKMLDRKAGDFVELQEIFILEHQIKGEFPKILKVVESLKKENVFNKPQLAGVIDMSTVYLLLDKPKKASKYLLADLKTFEEELVGSDLDNNRLMKIYFNLVDNKLETLNNDINELFTLDLQPEEVIAKSKILKNILQIIDVRNKKRPTASYHDVRNKIVDLFKSVIKGKNIPVFEKLLL